MTLKRQSSSTVMQKAAATALALALAVVPLAGCGGQEATDDGGSTETTSQQAAVDASSWKTMGDALSAQTGMSAAGWNDDYYVTVFQAGDSYFRVVAKMTEDAQKKLDEMDYSKGDPDEQTLDAVGDLTIEQCEDLTDKVIAQDELDTYVGKTGKELVDAGFTFQDYGMYGGDQTGANFTKDGFVYMFTFDATVSDDATDDEGAAVMDSKASEVELNGFSDDLTNPDMVK